MSPFTVILQIYFCRLTKADEAGVVDLLEFHFQKDIQARTVVDPEGKVEKIFLLMWRMNLVEMRIEPMCNCVLTLNKNTRLSPQV